MQTARSPSNAQLAPLIQVVGLTKRYGSFEAVHGINFEVFPGEIFGLIGPDGAGKTTTFHILGGVMEATGGAIDVLGKAPRKARLELGYLHFALRCRLENRQFFRCKLCTAAYICPV